jgi:lauroyl/myristoyl acyltransferase
MARALAAQADAIKLETARAGFTSAALGLTETVLRTWKQTVGVSQVLWPTNESCVWLLKRATAWTGQGWLAVGVLYPGTNTLSADALQEFDPALPGVWLTSWARLGEALLQDVEQRLWLVMGAMVALVGVCLWLAFRRLTHVLLSFATLAFSLLVLLATMSLAGWSWNLMNLMALPLLLGAGVDYTIHVQLALRRHAGDLVTMRRVTGRAVFLCAATTVAGFGSNALSSNAGLASLGLVCSTGIAIVYLSSVFLLPAWWCLWEPAAPARKPQPAGSPGAFANASLSGNAGPSSFYRAWLWRFGLGVVRVLPVGLVNGLCIVVAELHFRVQRQRREVVVRNLLPACGGDRAIAEQTTHRLYRRFAAKLADLWRFESGVPLRNWVAVASQREVIQSIQARGCGLLFVTLHLGNWELGGPLVAKFGIPLTVLSLAESEDGLTRLRVASRARWGIQTLIIGQNSFAFVEVIKRLQAGAAVAISIDRPPGRGAVEVEFFGRPFHASVAAAELARASGCALLGVTVVRTPQGHAVKVLPEFTYDRQALGSREARQELTQQILRAFEPEIRNHLDQWYHFVPIWP